MANALMATGLQTPQIDTMGSFAQGVNARQTTENNNLTLARKGMENIGAIALGAMGGKLDGEVNPEQFEQGLDLLAEQGLNVEAFRGRPEIAPVAARASLSALEQLKVAQSEADMELAMKNFQLELQKAAQGPDQPASVQEYQFYAEQERAAGREPASIAEYAQLKKGGGLTVTTNPDGTTTITQGGPGKLTEAQSKDVGFYTRGVEANEQLSGLEGNLTDFMQSNAGLVPLGIGNYMRTPEFRQAKVAADQFLATILRKDSGAAITDQEFGLYGPMFLPVPGDDPETIAQKRRMRDVALLAIGSGLGTAEAVGQANRAILGIEDPRAALQGDPDAIAAPEVPTGSPADVVDFTDYFSDMVQ